MRKSITEVMEFEDVSGMCNDRVAMDHSEAQSI